MAQQVLPVFVDQGGPDFRPIVHLHRGHDGYVSFGRKQDDAWEDLFSIKARELESYFPQLLPTFETDSYFSINGMYRGGHGVSRHATELGLPRAYRKNDGVRWITSCFVDLDCHALGIDVGTAVGHVVNLQDDGVIPPASMLSRSGRGLWAFWFLRSDDQDNEPVRAWSEKIRLWCNIQCAITRVFGDIGADPNRDAARVTRIPGSINSKSGKRVDHWIQTASNGKPFVYKLGDLAAELNVHLPTRHSAVTAVNAVLSQRGRKGQRGRWIKARSNFESLWELRGTFGEGTRNNAIFVYAMILRSQKLDESDVWAECNRLFADGMATGSQPFTWLDFEAAMKQSVGYKFGGMKNQTIADMLVVTPEEAAVLDNWPPASRFNAVATVAEVEKLSRTERAQRRQGLLLKKLAELKAAGVTVPPLRDLAAWLTDQGFEAAAATVTSDLKALKIENPRKRKRRATSRQRKFLK